MSPRSNEQQPPEQRSYPQQLTTLVKRLAVTYALMAGARAVFIICNSSLFAPLSAGAVMNAFFQGLRFDSFTIVVSQSGFILLSLLPIGAYRRRWYQVTMLVLFMAGCAVSLAPDLTDAGYFAFTRKRATADILHQVGGQSDIGLLLPQILRDYWHLLVIYVLLLAAAFGCYRITERTTGLVKKVRLTWSTAALFVLSCGLCVLAVRGGLQRVPIDVVNAGAVTQPGHAPMVLNSFFTIVKSASQGALPELKYFSSEEVRRIYDPHHKGKGPFKPRNVVVIILESFSKEYTRLGRNYHVTPFFDSLMGRSLVMTNGFANGTKSIEGIPAVLSGMPSLMEDPFINSIYANNTQTSLASLLGKKGYSTAFFHGGINGTMNFTEWAAAAGYQRYFGRDEYGNEADFDGFWGIWDEPFLQYACAKMDAMPPPFHAAVFTLSSHHPYHVPEQYKGRFRKGKLENAESLQYADMSLRRFFDTARKKSWYNNTLFVLCADHAGISEGPFYNNFAGFLCIPIVFFDPSGSLRGEDNSAVSQMDILPSVMDLLDYDRPYFAFGKSFRDTSYHHALFYTSGYHHLFHDSMTYRFTGDALNAVFNFRRDSALQNNLLGRLPALEAEASREYKAFIQTYNHVLNTNAGG